MVANGSSGLSLLQFSLTAFAVATKTVVAVAVANLAKKAGATLPEAVRCRHLSVIRPWGFPHGRFFIFSANILRAFPR